jgi:hypothetical protein
MNRQALKHWLIVGAFGATFLSGCDTLPQHPNTSASVETWNTKGCNTCTTGNYWNYGPAQATAPRPVSPAPLGPAPAQAVTAPPVVAVNAPVDGAKVILTSDQQSTEPPVEARQAPLARIEFQAAVAGGRAQLLPPELANAVVLPAPAAPPSQAPLAAASPSFPRSEPLPGRKAYVDPTAAPCFNHAADHSWLIGQVEYSRISKEWRIRYASVDEPDKFGGRMLLIENHHLSLLQDGQYVQVHGHVVNPDNAGTGPVFYRIESFEAVDNCNSAAPPTSSH